MPEVPHPGDRLLAEETPFLGIDRGLEPSLGRERAFIEVPPHPRDPAAHAPDLIGIAAGEAVFAGPKAVGEITSAAPDGEGSTVIARVRWDAATEPLTVSGGRSLDAAPVKS